MKKIALAIVLSVFALSSAYASCKSEATGKKLAGAALTSFMKKCETDAAATCDKTAMDRKLAGAAKTSFTGKCVSDAVGG
jgi:hypothetical protein